MEHAPIVLFVYNRADHFMRTFSALSECAEAADSELYIYSDGAKSPDCSAGVAEVRNAVKNVCDKGIFKNVTVVESPVNKGLAASIISGVTEVVSRCGKIIVLEDDCEVSPHFLKFMNSCLDYYESDKTVGSVSGYCPCIDIGDYSHDIFFAVRSCSCSWATWADRWEGIRWNDGGLDSFIRDKRLLKRLNSNGNDRFIRLYRSVKSGGSSWSVRFGAHHVLNDYSVVYPRFSYVSNIGCDATGTHSSLKDADDIAVDISKAKADFRLEAPFFDDNVRDAMYRFYSGNFISRLKRAVATEMIVLKERLGRGSD